MEMNETGAMQRLSELGMEDMPVMAYTPHTTRIPSDWFIKYKGLIHEFVSTLTDSAQEIAFMNLSPNEFMGLLSGQSIPQNISIRFRIPLTWGGELNIDNLFMCRTFPYSHNLDRFIIEQSGNSKIWLPNPAKKIYVPTNLTGGGTDGGNATDDRMGQIATQMATASRTE
ncbi:MAG: hypothetical protein KBS86_02520 [Proteobacteria bacterium]|nr:hypothetical protein [Candidatus Enterousia scatequi]